MTLELNIDGKNNIYHNGFINAFLFRKALFIQRQLETEGLNISVMDDMLNFVCDVFYHEFTLTDLYEGLERHEVPIVCANVIEKVINGEYNYTQRKILWK